MRRAAHAALGQCAADRTRRARTWCGIRSSARARCCSAVDRVTKAFDVRKAKRDPEAMSLSGGNLQKFVVGREFLREPGVLVVCQPTWGVDAGAAAVIRQALIDLAARGSAVLVISQDLDEMQRNFRPHRGDVPRQSVRADRNGEGGSRDARPADGRQQCRRPR